MSDLDERLRTALKASVDHVTPSATPEQVVRGLRRGRSPAGRGPTRRSRTAALVVAAVFVTVVLGVAVLALRGPGDDAGVVDVGPRPTAPRPPARPAGWTELPEGPRYGTVFPAAVWTGTELVVWGGETESEASWTDEGAAYAPATGTWRALAPSPLSPRSEHTAVWSGDEVIVCCGRAPDGDARAAAAYDPATDRWRDLAPPPFDAAFAVATWTGSEMVVTGGITGAPSEPFRGAAAYDPATDRWRVLADPPGTIERGADVAWTGERLVVWPRPAWDAEGPGLVYDPATDSWTRLPELPTELVHRHTAMVATGTEVIVWGVSGTGPEQRMKGARTRLDGGGGWRPITDAPIPAFRGVDPTRSTQATVWTGTEMVALAGDIGRDVPPSSVPTVAYDPTTDSWRPLAPTGPRTRPSPLLWAGDRVLVVDRPVLELTVDGP